MIAYYRRLIILSFIICSLLYKSNAQTPVSAKDTSQLNTWINNLRPTMDTNTDAAFSLITKMKLLAAKLKIDSLTAKVLNEEGYYYFNTGNYRQAAVVWDSSAVIWKNTLPHNYSYARAVNNLGNAYMYNSEYNKALVTFFEALKISEEIKNKKSVAQVFNNIGLVYESLGDYDNALLYARKSFAIKAVLKDSAGMANCYGNMANAFEIKQQPDSAIFYNHIFYSFSSLIGKRDKMANALGNMGHAFLDKKNYDSAVYYLKKGIEITEQLSSTQNNANLLNLIAYAYLKKGDLTNTYQYITKAAKYAGQISDKEFLQTHYQIFYEYYKKTGNTNKAIEYSEKFFNMIDSVVKEKINIQNQKMAISYEFKEKNREDSLVYQQQLEKSKQKITATRNKYTISLLLFLLAAAIAALFYSRSKFLQKKNIVAQQDNALQQQKIKELENEKQILASQAIVKGQEEERSRLAKDLHDGLGGLLSGVKHSIMNMNENVIIGGDHADAFEKSLNLIDTASKELRRVAQNMMPEALSKFGLEAALKDYCAAACTKTLKVTFQSYGNDIEIDKPSSIIIYRVIQELVNNAVKHADATELMVQMVKGTGWITLGVEDNGKGFDTAALQQSTGSGWSNIKSRVDYLKGNIDIKSQSGTGTSVNIEIKIPAA